MFTFIAGGMNNTLEIEKALKRLAKKKSRYSVCFFPSYVRPIVSVFSIRWDETKH